MYNRETATDESSHIRQLIKDLMGTEAIAREKARFALIEIGKPVIDYLAELTYTEKDIWRWEAVKALGQISDEAVIPILIDALEDKNGGVRWLAAEGLIGFGLDIIKPLLRALIGRQKSIFLNQGVHHVLYQIDKNLNLNGVIKSFLKTLKSPTLQEDVLIEARNLITYFENYHKEQ